MKKKIIIAFTTIACCALSIGLFSAMHGEQATAAETDTRKSIEYHYALLGDTYKVKQGLISAIDPLGNTLTPTDGEVLLDWSQGSYRFEYASHIIDMKVYEAAPEDSYTLLGEFPTSYVAGEEIEFPAMEIKSTIWRTDGAPKIQPYTVNAVFWQNNERIYSRRNVTESFTYTPLTGGLWTLSYEYQNVFGQVVSKDYPMMIEDRRIILCPLEDTAYNVGDKLALSDCYGYYQGTKYPLSGTVVSPSGKSSSIQSTHVFAEKGEYTITLFGNVAGEVVEKGYTVNAGTGLASFIGDKSGLTQGTWFNSPSNLKGSTVSPQGLLFDMTGNSASLAYNGIIDLRTMGTQTPVISFTTNNSYGGNITNVNITLTDVYDASNFVTVQFYRNNSMTATDMGGDNMRVNATFGKMSTAVNNYYGLKGSAIGWSSSFFTYWNSPDYVNPDKNFDAPEHRHTLNFAFDENTNRVYSYGEFHLVDWTDSSGNWKQQPPADYPMSGTSANWYPIADLDDPTLAAQFKGFTTGEVYLTLSVGAGKGDIMIHSIGGKGISVADTVYNDDAALTLGAFDESLGAVVGAKCAILTVSNKYVTDLTRMVRNPNGELVELQGDSFIPDQVGNYTVTYEGYNQFMRRISKTIIITCRENIPVEIEYSALSSVKIGSVYTIESPQFTGGYGKYDYTITVNGQEMSVGDKLVVDGDLSLEITHTDAVGTTKEEFLISADRNVVDFSIDFPRVANTGESFIFPEARIYDYATDKVLPYDVYVDGEKQTDNSMVLPSIEKTLQVEYRTEEKGSVWYELTVKKSAQTGKDGFLLASTSKAETFDEGTQITVNKSNTLTKLPYRISPNGMQFEFFILAKDLSFDEMHIRMMGDKGVSVKMSIVGLTGVAPKLWINGENTFVTVTKTAQAFSSGASAIYAGQAYYSFQLSYENFYRAALNVSKILKYITHDERGIAFNGFQGGVYLDFEPAALSGDQAIFTVRRISNQFFASFAIESGDITGPAFYASKFALKNANVKIGYELNISDVAAYDVLSGKASVTAKLTLPNGTVKYSDIAPNIAEKVTLMQRGTYVLTLRTVDKNGVVTLANYRLTVEDDVPPTIQVTGTLPATGKVGDTVTFSEATATDETTTNVKLVVFYPNGEVKTLATGVGRIESVAIEFKMQGRYVVRYIATDVAGNVAMSQAYMIVVEE